MGAPEVTSRENSAGSSTTDLTWDCHHEAWTAIRRWPLGKSSHNAPARVVREFGPYVVMIKLNGWRQCRRPLVPGHSAAKPIDGPQGIDLGPS